MCDLAHATLFERFEADMRAREAASGELLVDDYRARFDDILAAEPTTSESALPREEAELRKALGVAS